MMGESFPIGGKKSETAERNITTSLKKDRRDIHNQLLLRLKNKVLDRKNKVVD